MYRNRGCTMFKMYWYIITMTALVDGQTCPSTDAKQAVTKVCTCLGTTCDEEQYCDTGTGTGICFDICEGSDKFIKPGGIGDHIVSKSGCIMSTNVVVKGTMTVIGDANTLPELRGPRFWQEEATATTNHFLVSTDTSLHLSYLKLTWGVTTVGGGSIYVKGSGILDVIGVHFYGKDVEDNAHGGGALNIEYNKLLNLQGKLVY